MLVFSSRRFSCVKPACSAAEWNHWRLGRNNTNSHGAGVLSLMWYDRIYSHCHKNGSSCQCVFGGCCYSGFSVMDLAAKHFYFLKTIMESIQKGDEVTTSFTFIREANLRNFVSKKKCCFKRRKFRRKYKRENWLRSNQCFPKFLLKMWFINLPSCQLYSYDEIKTAELVLKACSFTILLLLWCYNCCAYVFIVHIMIPRIVK